MAFLCDKRPDIVFELLGHLEIMEFLHPGAVGSQSRFEGNAIVFVEHFVDLFAGCCAHVVPIPVLVWFAISFCA
jgi:hypothetical protein